MHLESPTSFKCEFGGCEKAFANKYALSNHLKTHDLNTFKCDICLTVLKNKINFEKHKKKHFAGKSFECSKCEVKFSDVQSLKAHTIKQHFMNKMEN